MVALTIHKEQLEEVTDATKYGSLQKFEWIISKVPVFENKGRKQPQLEHSVSKQKVLKIVLRITQWTVAPTKAEQRYSWEDVEGLHKTYAKLHSSLNGASQK